MKQVLSVLKSIQSAWWIGFLLILALSACSSPAPSLSITASASTVAAGGSPVTLKASGAQPITWSLSGPGSLSASSGPSIQYTPPAALDLSSPTTAIIQASAANLKASTILTVNPTLGALQLSVSGLPGGVNADVSLKGPENFSQNLGSAQKLTGLKPGTYTLSAASVVAGGITYTPSVTGSPVAVSAGNTATASVSYAAMVGSLEVKILGLPSGLEANVSVSGPGGFNQTVKASGTLSHLVPGTYTLEKHLVRQAGTLVDSVLEPSGPDSVSVTVAATASAQITYALQGGSGKLWISCNTGKICGYGEAKLSQSGSITSTTLLVSPDSLGAVAFDAKGNLWVSNPTAKAIYKLSAANLGAGNVVTPSLTLTLNTGLLAALAFDSGGNLWVSDRNNNTLSKFTPGQLLSSGSPVPAVTISANAGSLNAPASLAFDQSGNLWVTNFSSVSTVVRYTPAQLASSGNPVPSVTIGNAGSMAFPYGLAFDSGGNLWVSSFAQNTVVKLASADLGTSGTPAPAVILNANADSITTPVGLGFDNAGNLWVANQTPHTLVQFSSSQIASSGAPAPGVTITSGVFSSGFAFNPAAVR